MGRGQCPLGIKIIGDIWLHSQLPNARVFSSILVNIRTQPSATPNKNAVILVTVEGVLFIPFIRPIPLLQHKTPDTHDVQYF